MSCRISRIIKRTDIVRKPQLIPMSPEDRLFWEEHHQRSKGWEARRRQPS